MLNFRKVLLAASVASLALVGSANAQVYTVNAASGSTGPVAGAGYAFIEATTQLLPTIAIQVTASGTAPTTGTLILNSNVAITNGLATGSTSNLDVAVFSSTSATCATALDAASSVILSGPTQITASFGTLSAGITTFCVENLRVNASQVGSASTVTVTVGGVAGGNILPNSASAGDTGTVAYASKSISSVSIQPEGAAGPSPYSVANNVSTSICNVVPSSTSTAKLSGFAVDALSVTATPDALLTAAELSGTAAPAPTTGTQIAPVAASQGTRLAITFSNLVAGVNYYYTITQPGTAVVAAYAGATGSTLATAAGGSTTYPTDISVAYPVTVSGSTGTIYVGVTTNGTPLNPNTIGINLIANIPSNAAVQTFPTTPVAASVTLVGVATGYPQYSSTQTAYTSTAVSGSSGGLITSCSTTLLFPYVVNNSGFDTAMVITNASTGTGVTAGSGLCTVSFYGTGIATSPTTYSPTTTLSAVSAAGSTNNLSFTASGQAAGITGYAVATCNFVGAHGYAFLFSGAGTPAAYAADYLAVVLQSGASTLTPTF